jgi:hypothetical protein
VFASAKHLPRQHHKPSGSCGQLDCADRNIDQLHRAEISFFVGKEKVLAKKSSGFLTAAFIFMHRTMQSATEFYRIPFDHAIEIAGHVEI